jgi:hypothetical protein
MSERERRGGITFFLNEAANRQGERNLPMKYWWNYSERERQKHSEKNRSAC